MPSLALLLALPVLALAQSAGLDALKGRFTPPEQILLSGLLANPQAAQEFVKDGAGDQAAFETKWRARLAQFSTDYMGRPHPLNEKAHSLKEAVEPAQWGMLMATMRALKASSSWTDQAKLKIFLNMIDDADEGLKAGDARDAHKVESTANPKLTDAMQQYLASPAAKKALADEARLEQEARERAAREQADREQAERDRLAREQQPPAKDQPGQPPAKTPAAKTPPPAKVPAGGGDAAERERTAREQLEAAERARGNTGRVVDGSNGQGSPVAEIPPVQVTPGAGAGSGGSLPVLTLPSGSGSGPAAHAAVPAPSSVQDDDMAELRGMKKDARGGWRKWGAGGAGLLLGGLLGFLLGGPIGAAVGAALLGGGAFLGARYLWG